MDFLPGEGSNLDEIVAEQFYSLNSRDAGIISHKDAAPRIMLGTIEVRVMILGS